MNGPIDWLIEEDLLLVQREDLPLVQKESSILVEEDLPLVQEDLRVVQEKHLLLLQEKHVLICTSKEKWHKNTIFFDNSYTRARTSSYTKAFGLYQQNLRIVQEKDIIVQNLLIVQE